MYLSTIICNGGQRGGGGLGVSLYALASTLPCTPRFPHRSTPQRKEPSASSC